MRKMAFWGLFGVTLAVYGTMLGWSLPKISDAAGGRVPFDMRPGGYSFAEALEFVSALTPDGANLYLNVQQKLDIAYPALFTLSVFFAITTLLPRQLGNWRWLMAATALPIALFDYLENHAIALMIKAGTRGLTQELVGDASQWTVLKSSWTTAIMLAVLGLLAWRTLQRARRYWTAKTADLDATPSAKDPPLCTNDQSARELGTAT